MLHEMELLFLSCDLFLKLTKSHLKCSIVFLILASKSFYSDIFRFAFGLFYFILLDSHRVAFI